MPILTFKCECGEVQERFCKIGEVTTCKCGKEMKREFKLCPETVVTEKRVFEKNKNVRVGIEEITRERSRNHFVENHIDEAIQKVAENFGEKEAMAHAKRAGWLDKYSGKKITKIDTK